MMDEYHCGSLLITLEEENLKKKKAHEIEGFYTNRHKTDFNNSQFF